jgi:hypothetical protein
VAAMAARWDEHSMTDNRTQTIHTTNGCPSPAIDVKAPFGLGHEAVPEIRHALITSPADHRRQSVQRFPGGTLGFAAIVGGEEDIVVDVVEDVVENVNQRLFVARSGAADDIDQHRRIRPHRLREGRDCCGHVRLLTEYRSYLESHLRAEARHEPLAGIVEAACGGIETPTKVGGLTEPSKEAGRLRQ